MTSLDQLIVWVVVGLISGSLASRLVTWDSVGSGRWQNLCLGLMGAVVGGLMFRLFGWFANLDKIAVSVRDIVAALFGSLIVLLLLWIGQRFRALP